jgi:hypothetical protein
MKGIISITAITAVLFSACAKDDHIQQTNGGNNSNSTTVTGDFAIAEFTDGNPIEDKTADFSDYTFTFTADGKVTALKNSVATKGSYMKQPFHEGEGAKLSISFSDAPLIALSKKWQMDLISNSAIHLSDGSNSSEVLEFTAK